MEHTPGPWHIQIDGDGCKDIGRENEEALACTTGLSDDTEDTANAHLIAAAPELLEEIEGLLGELGRTGLSDMPGETFADLRNRVDSCCAAIAKATGA